MRHTCSFSVLGCFRENRSSSHAKCETVAFSVSHYTPYVLADLPLHASRMHGNPKCEYASYRYVYYSVRSAHAIIIPRFRGSRSSSRGQIAKHVQFPILTFSAHESRVRESRSSSHARNCRISRVHHAHACMGTLYVLGSICACAWFPRITLSFRECRSSRMHICMQSKMRNCIIFRVPWIL
jgi:hypothetical protein